MLYNPTTVKKGLVGTVGWKNNRDSQGTTQLKYLTSGTSGMFFNDVSPLLTFRNVESIADRDTNNSTVAKHDTGGSIVHAVDEVVEGTDHKIYVCTLGHTGDQAPPNTTYWKETNLFTEWLREKTEASILMAVSDWYNKKFMNFTANSLVENKQLFKTAPKLENTTNDVDGITVGMEIAPRLSRNIKLSLHEVGFIFNGTPSFTLYLYKAGTSAAIQTKAVTITTANTEEWITLDWDIYGDSTYWLVYNVTGPDPVNGVLSYDQRGGGRTLFSTGKFAGIKAFQLPSGVAETSMWDLSKNVYTISDNYGINLRYSVYCDYTNLIVQQKHIFSRLIAHRVANDMIRTFALNPDAKLDRNTVNLEYDKVMFELTGTEDSRIGLMKEYSAILNGIQFDTTDIDTLCLPCRRRRGMIKPI
jgi:hypothetical protein